MKSDIIIEVSRRKILNPNIEIRNNIKFKNTNVKGVFNFERGCLEFISDLLFRIYYQICELLPVMLKGLNLRDLIELLPGQLLT